MRTTLLLALLITARASHSCSRQRRPAVAIDTQRWLSPQRLLRQRQVVRPDEFIEAHNQA